MAIKPTTVRYMANYAYISYRALGIGFYIYRAFNVTFNPFKNISYQEKHNAVKNSLGFASARLNDAGAMLKYEFFIALGFSYKKPDQTKHRREYIKQVFSI